MIGKPSHPHTGMTAYNLILISKTGCVFHWKFLNLNCQHAEFGNIHLDDKKRLSEYNSLEVHAVSTDGQVFFKLMFIIENTNEKPGEKMHRSRKIPSTGASVCWGWGVPPSQHRDIFTNLETLNPIVERFLQSLHHVGNLQPPRTRSWANSSKLPFFLIF